MLKRVSKPGKRVYTKKADIPKVLSGFGISIISTNKGIMTGYEARKKNLGGEIICYVG
jgi:small subunit ribosomal protein S8